MHMLGVKRSERNLLFGESSIGRYGLIGLSGVSIDTSVFYLLTHNGVEPLRATVLGTALGITNNYILNSRLNFKKDLRVATGFRFAAVGLTGVFASAILLKIALGLGLTPMLGKLCTIPLVVLGQFIGNKYWTFRPRS